MSPPTSATAARKGAGDGAQEAAKVIGWDFRILDGQGSVQGRTTALNQAIALKPDGIILGNVDALEQAPVIQKAAALGIKMVGWHVAPAPGPVKDPPVITNVTTDPREVAKAAALYAVVDSNGTAKVILFKDSITTISTVKTDTTAEVLKGCAGCKVITIEDTPMGDLANRMPSLTTSLLAKYSKDVDLQHCGERSVFRFLGAVAAVCRRRLRQRLPAADFVG